MQPTTTASLLPTLVPHVRLHGKVDEDMLSEFLRQQREAPRGEPLVFELSTLGGSAEIGRRLAEEIRLWQAHGHADLYFLGKTFVYSAGVTIMSAFPAARRVLTQDTVLLIHERRLSKTLVLQGALRACAALVADVQAEIASGQQVEDRDFAQLVLGSRLSHAALREQVMARDWYLPAREALDHGLVAALL